MHFRPHKNSHKNKTQNQ